MNLPRTPHLSFPIRLFVVVRLLLTVWAAAVLLLLPQAAAPNETLRPYLGQPILSDGAAGLLLGPWQRFDTLRYTRIAQNGYANEEDSVFPPLYPLAIRLGGRLLGGSHAANVAAALLIANGAALLLLLLLYHITAAETDRPTARRAVLYLALFPTSFFLFAGYSESLFILLAAASIWLGKNGRFLPAGLLGILAALTRLTGWVLVAPLLWELWRQRKALGNGRFLLSLAAAALPGVGTLLFIGYRQATGLPPLSQIYSAYWFQTTGIPGTDLVTALRTMLFSGAARAGEFTLWFDFFCLILLLVTTWLAFKRLGAAWGLYAALLLLFMLLPVSPVKPLYSFSRYALAFIPTFILLAQTGQNPIIHRLIIYPSLALALYFSGQFFLWGWVA